MKAHVDCSKARSRMLLRARHIRDVAHRPLEKAAADAAREASATTAWKDQTGATRSSIKAVTGPGLNKSGVVAKKAAIFLEAGTGRYGLRGRDYIIAPKNGGTLAFQVGGRWVHAKFVIHPGIKATHFMQNAAEKVRPSFVEACVRAVHAALTRP